MVRVVFYTVHKEFNRSICFARPLEMTKLKEGLDPKQRKHLFSYSQSNRTTTNRLTSDKGLRPITPLPSSATLIIVPSALLEHWYDVVIYNYNAVANLCCKLYYRHEQITKHLNLKYYTSNGEGRSVVYLDGLGDIVDVEVC